MQSKITEKWLIGIILIVWVILNAIQAYFTQLHPDEAYYWLFSKQLSWGYFDHPPMIAAWINSTSFLAGEIGVRLSVVLCSALSIYVLYCISQRFEIKTSHFLLIVFSFLMIHTYGFIATPDAPLFLFSCLFYYFLFQYIEKDSLNTVLILGAISACLLYSKYHGALLILFSCFAYLPIFKRKTLWIGLGFAVVLFIPHLLWQYNHLFPSFQYHFIDRSSRPYTIQNTTAFISNQWLILGPFTSLIVFWASFKVKTESPLVRILKLNFWGMLLFFFISSFKGWVEAHWTFIVIIPGTILTGIYFKNHTKTSHWFRYLSIVSIFLYLLLRFLFIVPNSYTSKIYVFKEFFYNKEWAKEIRKYAKDRPVIFEDKFQSPSLYKFYNNNEVEAYAVNTWYYRKNQFNIWNSNNELRNKAVYACTVKLDTFAKDSIVTKKGTILGAEIDRFNTFPNLKLSLPFESMGGKPGEDIPVFVKILNTNSFEVDLDSIGQMKHAIAYTFKTGGDHYSLLFNKTLVSCKLSPGDSINIPLTIHLPESRGKYDLLLGIQSIPFMPLINSKPIEVNVD
jgi:hypothetical protein